MWEFPHYMAVLLVRHLAMYIVLSYIVCGLQDGGLRMCDPTVTSESVCKKDKLCLVCGDKALGYNFNAVS